MREIVKNIQNLKPVQELKSKFYNPGTTNLLLVNEERLFIFFSVDICNSTKLKSKNVSWFEANKLLYNERMMQLHFWKYNGDEVLYAEPFSDIETLVLIIEEAYLYIKRMQNEMKKRLNEEDFQLKGTIWLARTCSGEDKKPNLHIKSFNWANEFLGCNIDEGFRLTKKISGSKIAIDPKIVYLLLITSDIYNNGRKCSIVKEKDDFFELARGILSETEKKISKILKNTYFVNYTQLKGIWDNRRYPVFWYYEERQDYAYDEQLDNEYIEPQTLSSAEWVTRIEDMFKAVNTMDEFLKIVNIISIPKSSPYTWESFSRLYYSIACVNPKSHNVLILQRSEGRRHLKNVWEFVPYKHTSKETVSSLEKKFSDEFNIKIKIVTDGEEENNILPVHFCTIYRNGQAHNSLLCLAIIDLNEDDEEIISRLRSLNSERYKNYKFVSESQIDCFTSVTIRDIEIDSLAALSDNAKSFPENSAIMYLENSVKAIRKTYSKIQNTSRWYEL